MTIERVERAVKWKNRRDVVEAISPRKYGPALKVVGEIWNVSKLGTFVYIIDKDGASHMAYSSTLNYASMEDAEEYKKTKHDREAGFYIKEN